MADNLGSPPSAPGDRDDAVAECVECGHTIRSDVKRCGACGARQVTKGQAAVIVLVSIPLWAITVGSVELLLVSDSAFVQGFLVGMSLLGPGATLVGVAKYRERSEALRAGASDGGL